MCYFNVYEKCNRINLAFSLYVAVEVVIIVCM